MEMEKLDFCESLGAYTSGKNHPANTWSHNEAQKSASWDVKWDSVVDESLKGAVVQIYPVWIVGFLCWVSQGLKL